MIRILLCFSFLTLPHFTYASTCDELWFHVAGVSKHITVYEPTQYTRYKRQTHPGFGVECQTKQYTLSLGEFTNSLNKPFQYGTVAKAFFNLSGFSLFAGILVGEYGRTERESLRLIAPVTYIETKTEHLGLNFFVLPPVQGVNDYAIFYTQLKIRY